MKAHCGDHIADDNEQCDGGESCTANCRIIVPVRGAVCGDGFPEGTEQCDDGNTFNGDGCSADCRKEVARPACGNTILESGEDCDDGNTVPGDGCSKTCLKEPKQVKEIPKPVQVAIETLDADIVIVNPTEIANALKFVDNTNPCAMMVRKGKNSEATVVRSLAEKQGIRIVQDIPLAHTLFDTIAEKSYVTGILCGKINALKKPSLPKMVAQKPVPLPVPKAIVQKAPMQPTTTAYGYYNYAMLMPIATGKPPAGQTGPEALIIAVAGASGGLSWVRRKLKK